MFGHSPTAGFPPGSPMSSKQDAATGMIALLSSPPVPPISRTPGAMLVTPGDVRSPLCPRREATARAPRAEPHRWPATAI